VNWTMFYGEGGSRTAPVLDVKVRNPGAWR